MSDANPYENELGLYVLQRCEGCGSWIQEDEIWCPHCGVTTGVINPISYEVAESIPAQAQRPAEAKEENSMFILNSPLQVLSPPEADKSRPPQFGEYILYLFLLKKDRDNVLGDLQEEYSEVLLKFGRTKAKIWYYKQVYTSIWPLLRRALLKWTALIGIGEWIRRLIS